MISPLISGWLHNGQVKAESLSRVNALEDMRENLEAKRLALESLTTQVKIGTEDTVKQEDMLGTELRSLLVAGTTLSVKRKGLEVLFSGY